MQNFYIKNEKNNYCIIDSKEIEMEGFFLFTFLMQKLNVLASNDALNAMNQLIEEGGFWGIQENYYGKKESFYINILGYHAVALKNNSHETDRYSLSDIQNNFKKLQSLQAHYKTILDFINQHKAELMNVLPKEIKKYVNIEGQYNLICYSKKNYSKETYYTTSFFKQVKIAEFLKNPFDKLIQNWEKVLDSNGTPKTIEDNNFYEKFNEKEGYALFCNARGRDTNLNNSGFWGSTNSSLTDINQAKLFQNEAQAERYRKTGNFHDIAVVKVKVKFEEVVNRYGSIDVTPLEAAKAAQEKAYLDSLPTNLEEIKSLATKLLSACGTDNLVLKKELEKLIEQPHGKNVDTQKTRQKI